MPAAVIFKPIPPLAVGIIAVPVIAPLITGLESVGAVPNTAAPVPVSSVKELIILAEVIELAAVPYKVPVVGKVTVVAAVDVMVVANAPEVVNAPPSVIVLPAPLAIPVPPLVGDKTFSQLVTPTLLLKRIPPVTTAAAAGSVKE